MILYALAAVGLLTAVLIIVMIIFGLLKHNILQKVMVWGIFITIVLGIINIAILGTYRSDTKKLNETYDNLILYHSTISESKNEYIRFDYYSKVLDYNKEYEQAKKASTSLLTGNLMPDSWIDDINRIEFLLLEE